MKKNTKITLILLFLFTPLYFFNNCQNQSFESMNQGSQNQSSISEDGICKEWDTEAVCEIRKSNIKKNQKRDLLDLSIKTPNPFSYFLDYETTFPQDRIDSSLGNRAFLKYSYIFRNIESFDFNVFGTCNDGGFFDHIISWNVFLLKQNSENKIQQIELCQNINFSFENMNGVPVCIQEAETNHCRSGKFFLLVQVPKNMVLQYYVGHTFESSCEASEEIQNCFIYKNDYFRLKIKIQLVAWSKNLEKITNSTKSKKNLYVEIRQQEPLEESED